MKHLPDREGPKKDAFSGITGIIGSLFWSSATLISNN